MNPVSAASMVSPVGPAGPSQTPAPATGPNGGFGKLVGDFVNITNQTQVGSEQAIDDLIRGKTDNVEQVVMAVANAEMSFQLFMEIRNQLIEAYNELMRMQF